MKRFFQETGRMTYVSVASVGIGVGLTKAVMKTSDVVIKAIERLPLPDQETASEIIMRQNG